MADWDVVSHKPAADPWAVVSHAPTADATPPATFGNTLLGEGELLGSGVANIVPAGINAGADLVSRVTGNGPREKQLVPTVPVGEAGKSVVKNVADLLPSGKEQPSIAELRAYQAPGDEKLTDDQLRQKFARTDVGDIVKNSGTVAGDLGTGAMHVAGDVGAIAGAASVPRAVAGAVNDVRNAASGIKSVIKGTAGDVENLSTPDWKKAGLRTADDHPIARNVAGNSGREALTLQNLPVGNTIAANDAGVAAGQPLSEASLKAGRTAPNSVYDRVAKGLPTTSLASDTDTAAAIKNAGSPKEGRITTGSPAAQQQIAKLKAELLDPDRQFTGQQVINELRGLRQEAGVNAASDDVSNREIGNAQHDMADSLEGHISRNLPKDGDVSLEQFQDARRALAKNFTVQGALRGKYVDPQALARVHSNNPGLLDGGLETYAQFAAEHPEVATLPSPGTRYNPPGLSRDFSDIDLKKPITYPQPLVGAAARRVLTGNPGAALDQANSAFPPRAPGAFAPIPPPPPPKIAGLLPSPAMVNAGSGVTTSSTLDNLGLTPDVQAAAAAHPGAPRLGALQRTEPARGPMGAVDFRPPENWSPALQANGAPPAPAAAQGGVPFADVLSHGVEQPPAPGLSLGPMEAPGQQGIPFRQNPDFLAAGVEHRGTLGPLGSKLSGHSGPIRQAGPLFTTGPELSLSPEDSWFNTDNRERLKDMADVMRQGVPDGTMTRTAPGVRPPRRGQLANNASGESAASMEAISRGTKPLAVIDPDGNAQPLLRDVTQVDRSAPKGHLIINTSTGEIVDRGGLTQAAANGLRNRWAALRAPVKPAAAISLETPEETRLRLLARALKDSK